MAFKIATTAGNWSTAGTWSSVSNTPTLHATTNVTISTSSLFSATFTAPNTVNACNGVMVYLNAIGTGGTITIALQQATIDVTTATVTVASLANKSGGWIYIPFPTPFTYTTTSAGTYRIRVINAGATGTTSFAADTGAVNFAYFASDNRTGVPASTDDCFVPVAVTVNGTQTCGSGASTTVTSSNQRAITNGLSLCNNGSLTYDTSASTTLNVLGNIVCYAGSSWTIDYSAVPRSRVATLRLTQVASVDFGIQWFDRATHFWKGASIDIKGTYASGTGIAADPLILSAPVNWEVGDEIIIEATSNSATNYNEAEVKFIKTVNSTTSFVLSNTVGGAESAYTYTHAAGCFIYNVTRNVIITTNSPTTLFSYGINSNANGTPSTQEWIENNGCCGGTVGTNKTAFAIHGIGSPYAPINFNYNTSRNRGGVNGFYMLGYTQPRTSTGIIVHQDANTITAYGAFVSNASNLIMQDWVGIKLLRSIFLIQSVLTTVNDCNVNACNSASSTVGALYINAPATGTVINRARINASKQAITVRTNGVTWNDCKFGEVGYNNTDIYTVADVFAEQVFYNSNFFSPTFFTNYLLTALGTNVRFHNKDDIAYNHQVYTSNGILSATGAGLSDTNVSPKGNRTLRFAPENATDALTYSFQIPVKVGESVSIFGYIQKNATLGTDPVVVSLFLPGSTAADATYTMPNDTNWNLWNLIGAYAGSVNGLATITVSVTSATVGAYAYLSDILDGTNITNDFSTWERALPIPIVFQQLGDSAATASAVWSDTATYGTGTKGKLLNKLLKTSTYLGNE